MIVVKYFYGLCVIALELLCYLICAWGAFFLRYLNVVIG